MLGRVCRLSRSASSRGFLCNRTKQFIKTRQLAEQTEQSHSARRSKFNRHNRSSSANRTETVQQTEQTQFSRKNRHSSADRTDTVQQTEQTQFSMHNRTIAERAGTNTGKQIEQGSI
jgi:hypothetical protein